MQLFLLEHIDNKGNQVIIDNPELRSQAKKVLRLEAGDLIFIQDQKARYEVEITALRDLKIFGKVKNTINAPSSEKPITTMLIAMPNKREKIELIVQKLCEIGIDTIIFRPSERSIIKIWNAKKEERLMKIVKEAVEQSRGWTLPTVTFSPRIDEQIKNTKLIVFDKSVTSNEGRVTSTIKLVTSHATRVTGLIGPEGGLTPNDYKCFEAGKPEIKDLGTTVLRMETAAIVGGWIIKNGL